MYTEEAEVLILDEPTSSLDETTEKDILDGISHCLIKLSFLITSKICEMLAIKFTRSVTKSVRRRKSIDELSK